RFLAIYFPLRPPMKKRVACYIMVFIWLFALCITLPWALFFDLTAIPELPGVIFCLEVWPEHLSSKYYFLFGNLLASYVLPLGLITLFYSLIWIKVSQADRPPKRRRELSMA
ncbi:unnamed protein product, partial [Cyprideis torosa]